MHQYTVPILPSTTVNLAGAVLSRWQRRCSKIAVQCSPAESGARGGRKTNREDKSSSFGAQMLTRTLGRKPFVPHEWASAEGSALGLESHLQCMH